MGWTERAWAELMLCMIIKLLFTYLLYSVMNEVLKLAGMLDPGVALRGGRLTLTLNTYLHLSLQPEFRRFLYRKVCKVLNTAVSFLVLSRRFSGFGFI